jgi:hypothetical protein
MLIPPGTVAWHDRQGNAFWPFAAISTTGAQAPVGVGRKRSMAFDPTDQWASVSIGDSLVGRKAGGSAADKARDSASLRTWMARLRGVHTDERAWRRGATGERVAAWWLGRLPAGWHLFNDIAVGDHGANVDHVLVGPAGVFTVNAKNLTGKIWVGSRSILHNGHKTSFLPKAVAEAKRTSKLLSAALDRPIDVYPILAILADDWRIKERPTDVLVAAPRGVKDWLRRQPAVLSPADVTAISAVVNKPATWQPG